MRAETNGIAMKKPATLLSIVLTPLLVTVLVASCNPGSSSGGGSTEAGRADGHSDANSCNPPPDYANCASCVETNCGGALQSICAGFENAYCGCIDHPADAGRDAGTASSPSVAQCVTIAANASCQTVTANCVLHSSCVCACTGGCDGGMDSGPDAPTDAPPDAPTDGSDAMSCVNQLFSAIADAGPACAACLDSSCSVELSIFASDCSAFLSCACPGGVLRDAGTSAICDTDLDAGGCRASFNAIQACATSHCIPPCK
jgi:hypothetical protein